ncbi:LacI family DNA-binding transcriptional regulator [Tessaracoccus caeni]|uniref:LacI family DNA-binding transcriptional regulator n=1 Tax=Tessaracoccus caeni TaxID=3031239 RepID=UPI0023DB8ABA|nr:LacI family DNA-binding transcriptional regulator [Tessaracoccus caeni]MDF1488027.1 LacI family DNA-binding transcriptional regulator [Tessaracoccus caeni]
MNKARRVRIKDVAARAGVSPSTVSVVLNDVPARISSATAEAVRTAAKELGYHPDLNARSLRRKQTQLIGMITDSVVTTPYAPGLVLGAQEAAWERQHLMLIANTERDAVHEEEVIEALLAQRVAGFLIAATAHEAWSVPRALHDVPVVGLNVELDGAPSFVPDEYAGAEGLAKLLVAAGHRRIALLHGRSRFPAAVLRAEAHADVTRAAQCYDGLLVAYHDHASELGDSAFGELAALRLLRLPDPPTAIMAFNDRMAVGVYHAARTLGLSIPDELSVVGFDNQILVAEELRPGLTTVDLPHRELGYRATSALLALLEDRPEDVEGGVLRLPCPLVERTSVASPPSGR